MNKLAAPYVFLLLLVVGCQNTGAPGGEKSTAEKVEPKMEPPTASVPEPPKLDRSQIPAEVKTLAFEYIGLGRDASPMFELTGGPSGITTGSIKTELIELKDGEARFRQSWTDGLAYLPETELVARKDGVFAVKAGGQEVNPPQVELPADVKAGAKWKSANTLTIAGATIKSSEVEIVGTKPVKTKAGSFDAMAVRATVVGTRDGRDLKATMTAYYVKGTGPVKIEIQSPDATGKMTNSVLEAVKK